MPTLTTADPRQRLARRASRALGSAEGFVRVEVPWPDAPDALAWLAAHADEEAAYWSGRDDETIRAGVGVAYVIEGPDALRLLSEAAPTLPDGAAFLGGLRFDASAQTEREWAGFGAGRFVLPRVELVVKDEGATLALNLLAGRDSAASVREALDAVSLDAASLPPVLDYPVARVDRPDRQGWHEAVESALGAMERGEMDKVVLARRATYRFEEALDPAALLARLTEAAPTAFHVLLSDGAGRQFVAATPELLVRVSGTEARTEAVAGTRRRGDGPDARTFHAELAESEKDRREHAFVRDFIMEALAPLASVVCVETPFQIEAARVRHLKTPLRATLREEVGPLEVVEALHPTPAVGGTPPDSALGAIRRLEGFDRGFYAGPVGWVSNEEAEFAVGIRSGLLCGKDLALYAGAGIVPGSVPEAEWHETEAKLGAFADALGLEG